MLDVLAAFLPRLGIRRCYIGLYVEPAQPAAGLQLVFRFEGGQRIALPPDGLPLPSRCLLPADALQAAEEDTAQTDLVVAPLHSGEQQIGVLICGTDPAQGLGVGKAFETLRSQLSSALTGVRLRRELEEARRQADEANQLKSRFLAMVSHELRTPRAQIVGLRGLASLEAARLNRSPEVLAEKLLAHHAQIHVSAQHLDRLIRDVLGLARQQVGQLRLDMQPFDLRELLAEVARLGEHMAAERKLAWRSELPQEQLPVVGDRARLQQVLLNLLANAVKFTPRGEVALLAMQQDGWVTIEVSDTGIGVPPADQAAIFNEFHRAPGAIARGFGGLGLGLAVTRRLVELHDGRIGMRSSGMEGQGSIFYFALPIVPSSKTAAGRPAEADRPSAGPVLIVGSHPDDGRVLQKRLTDDGFEAVVAQWQPGEDLLPLMRQHAPGTVIIECAPELEPLLTRLGLGKDAPRASPTILIVDDDAEMIRVHELLVRERLPGRTVLTATGGRAALAILRDQSPDLVLLDLMMPEVDGFDVLAGLRADPRTRHVPVVVLTGQALSELDMERLARGVTVVLSKGVLTTQETIARISDILAHAPQLGTEGQRQVRRAIAYIHANYAEPISRRGIAGHLGLHMDPLSRYFSEEIGVSIVTFLNRYRLVQACKLLESTHQSITEIAGEVGFESHSYFTRTFLRDIGVTPTEYRQRRCRG